MSENVLNSINIDKAEQNEAREKEKLLTFRQHVLFEKKVQPQPVDGMLHVVHPKRSRIPSMKRLGASITIPPLLDTIPSHATQHCADYGCFQDPFIHK